MGFPSRRNPYFLVRGSCVVYSGKGRQRTFLGLATGGFGVGTTAVTAGGVWVSLAAGVSPGCKKYPGRGGVFASGGVGVAGLWRARWWLLVVCLCLSVRFKVFYAMFFYMYENMAEFCLGVCDKCRATEAWKEQKTSSRHVAQQTGTRRANGVWRQK